jgi:hypothetical protein
VGARCRFSKKKNLVHVLPLALTIWLGTGENANDYMAKLGTDPCLDTMVTVVFSVRIKS